MSSPQIWGPYFWNFFHTLSFKYPDDPSDKDKIMMKNFVNSIKYVIPCKECSNHFKENLSKYPLYDDDLSSKEKFIDWFINFHNVVNLCLKKETIKKSKAKELIYTFKDKNLISSFKHILVYIEDDINDDIRLKKCEGIKVFIISVLYFAKKEYNIDLDFYDYSSYKEKKKNLKKII
jgi:hypothetical protein